MRWRHSSSRICWNTARTHSLTHTYALTCSFAYSITCLLPHSLTRTHLYTLCEKIQYACGAIRSFHASFFVHGGEYRKDSDPDSDEPLDTARAGAFGSRRSWSDLAAFEPRQGKRDGSDRGRQSGVRALCTSSSPLAAAEAQGAKREPRIRPGHGATPQLCLSPKAEQQQKHQIQMLNMTFRETAERAASAADVSTATMWQSLRGILKSCRCIRSDRN